LDVLDKSSICWLWSWICFRCGRSCLRFDFNCWNGLSNNDSDSCVKCISGNDGGGVSRKHEDFGSVFIADGIVSNWLTRYGLSVLVVDDERLSVEAFMW
jgi:hypothetical protein